MIYNKFFISGAGTGVGKTLVTGLLARQLAASGKRVQALKPVISGFEPEHPETSDSGLLLRSCDLSATPKNLNAISPWRFAAPLSPDMAAQRESRELQLQDIINYCTAALSDSSGQRVAPPPETGNNAPYTLVEGVGGVMAPLNAEHTVLDWMVALGWPVLLVAGSYLGTLSHTLSALEVLRHRRVLLAGLVISASEASPVPLEETAASLRHFMPPDLPVLLLPRLPLDEPAATSHDAPCIDWGRAMALAPDLTGMLLP